MNLLKKQGFLNSIILYIGTGLGFFNGIILFNRFLPIEAIGFFTILTSVAPLFAQIASIGFTSVITRYLPFYRTEDKRHKGFPLFVILICAASFTILTLAAYIFKESIMDFYSREKHVSFMQRYYFYIVPVVFFSLSFIIQEAFAKAIFKSVFAAFLREVGLKLFTTVGVLLVAFQLTDFKGFLNVYLFSNIILFVVLSFYNIKVQAFKLSRISTEVRTAAGSIIFYGFFSMLSGSSYALIQQSLPVMILKVLSSEEMVGIFGMFFNIAMVISLPARALNTTSYQIISDSWKNEDLKKINKIYHKTSVVQLLIGALLLVGLIINRDFLLFLLHKKIYQSYFDVFIIIGIGFLIDITGGLNQAIISFSKHYKIVMIVLVGSAFLCALMNIILVPLLGVMGAAISYVLTMASLNFVFWLYLKLKFGLQPFNKSHLYILAISFICLLIGLFLPSFENLFIDMIMRSGVVTVCYLSLIYIFKVSDDINSLYTQLIKRLFG